MRAWERTESAKNKRMPVLLHQSDAVQPVHVPAMPFDAVRRRQGCEREAGEGGQAFREVEQRKNGGKERRRRRRRGVGWEMRA